MELVGTRQKQLLGLGIARVFNGRIFFENARKGVADLVFISTAFGLNGKGDGGFGNRNA
jgi:hypothetical protein